MASRAVLYGSALMWDDHETGRGHPERQVRLEAVELGVAAAALGDGLVSLAAREPDLSELTRVHSREYLQGLTELCELGGGHLDADTPVAPGSCRTATRSAGLGLAAIDALRDGAAAAAFVAPRPPGHHAFANRGSGFCLINNVAVAAAALTATGERVLIVDWDVHHGNGTQDIFWDDPRVMYVSTHEYPAYPGTGPANEIGGPNARGLTINVPLPSGATGDAARRAIDDIVAEPVDAFAPDWVLISAGFDAHRADPLADLQWSAGDFATLARRVAGFAPQPGRVIAFLEGGYDLAALADSVQATVAALAGESRVSEPETSGGPGLAAVDAARRIRLDSLEA